MFKGYIGQVVSVKDDYHGERIKAFIPSDVRNVKKIPYAFPLLPKMIHVKPKVGEAVVILIPNGDTTNEQRFYIGPIISQPQKMEKDSIESLSATKMLQGGIIEPENSVDNDSYSATVFPKNDEIAIMGRKSSEIIIGDDDIRLRCGVRVTKNGNVSLNGRTGNSDSNIFSDSSIRTAPAFIKLKYHETPIEVASRTTEPNPHPVTLSTATIVADKVNLISQNGDGHFNLRGDEEAITDEKMKEILEKAHRLPYGDVLCEFLSDFYKMFIQHYHPSNGAPPPNTDPARVIFDTKYPNTSKNGLSEKLLSKDIRIN